MAASSNRNTAVGLWAKRAFPPPARNTLSDDLRCGVRARCRVGRRFPQGRNSMPMSRNRNFMSSQTGFLAAGFRSRYEGWYVQRTLARPYS